jgi:hypothetical protein
MPDIYRIEDINVLRAVKEAVKNVKTLDEIKSSLTDKGERARGQGERAKG